MKIGILTYHCVPNFGAQLQASSTVGFIKRMGHQPVVLHYYPQDLEDMYSRRIPGLQVKAHDDFTRTWLPVTDICRTEDDLIKIIEKCELDAIISGSDALFKYSPSVRLHYFSIRKLRYVNRKVLSVSKLSGNPFFGGFLAKLKKTIPAAAFSVSSQNCPYYEMNYEEKTMMKSALQNYLLITVRDEWTKQMVENIIGIEGIQVTPDPVFSFNQNCYIPIPTKEDVLRKYHLNENYILFSFSGMYAQADYIHDLSVEAEKLGYQSVAFPMPELLYSAGIKAQVNLPLDPIDWYALIKYSSGYIGERMHPIVVCLHNAVPFFSFDEYGIVKKSYFGLKKEYFQESSKTYRILERAKLTNYMFSYFKKEPMPSPNTVIKKIIEFDRDACAIFAERYQHEYEMIFSKILSQLDLKNK